MYISRKIAHLVSTLLMFLPWPKFFAGPQELDLLPGKIELTVSSDIVFVRLWKSTDKISPRNRLIMMSSYEKFYLMMKQSTSSRFALNIQSFSCSLRNQLNSFLSWWTLRVRTGILSITRIYLVWDDTGWRLWAFRTRSPSACQNVTNAELPDATFALAGSCKGMSATWNCLSASSSVKSTIGTNLPAISSSLLGT